MGFPKADGIFMLKQAFVLWFSNLFQYKLPSSGPLAPIQYKDLVLLV